MPDTYEEAVNEAIDAYGQEYTEAFLRALQICYDVPTESLTAGFTAIITKFALTEDTDQSRTEFGRFIMETIEGHLGLDALEVCYEIEGAR